MTTHKFEEAGLGRAPFKVTGMTTKRGPLADPRTGILVGAPGQPMGSCDYCGTPIAECWQIRSSDGKESEVGCVCVYKTGDAGIVSPVKREVNRRRRERTKVLNQRRIDAANERVGDSGVQEILSSLDPPQYSLSSNALDWATWMLEHAGMTGRMKVVRFMDKALEKEVKA